MFTVAATNETISPRNIAVINGSTTKFSCVIDAPQSEVCWARETVSPKKYNTLYKQGDLTSVCNNNRCDVTHNYETDRYTLTINSVQHYDAGFYECSECIGSGQQSAQLIVLEPADRTKGMYARCISVRPSVRDVPVLDENGLTYCHIFTIR